MTTGAGRSFLGWWMGREYVTVTLDFAAESICAIEKESFAAGRAAALGEVRRVLLAELSESPLPGARYAYEVVSRRLVEFAHPAEAEPEERLDAD